MKRNAITVIVFLVAIWAGMAAVSQESARIVDIRFGKHADYDRVVIEIERHVDIRWVPTEQGEAFALEIDARPAMPHQRLDTPFQRMGTLTIEQTGRGARLLAEPKGGVRVFRLTEPARVVVDFGEPGLARFVAPVGTDAILQAKAEVEPEARPEPPLVVEEEPEMAEAPEPNEGAEAMADDDDGLEGMDPEAEDEPNEADEMAEDELNEADEMAEDELNEADEMAEDEADIVEETEAIISPPKPQTEPTWRKPEVTQRSAPPEPRSKPAAAAPEGPGGWLVKSFLTGLVVLAVIAVFVLLVAFYRMRVNRRRRVAAQARAAAAALPRAAETITPAEVAGAGDRVDLLDKRIDEEVRARMQLEERLTQLHEELRVMRDRLSRATRHAERD